MKYRSPPDYHHDQPEALGVLLVNLGTPTSPTISAVRRYLAEFLSDPRVVELPRPLWWLILHGVVLRVRPPRSARLYQSIWTPSGSPLLVISQRQATALQLRLSTRCPGPVRVVLAMRYGIPSIAAGLEALQSANARRLLVLPLYPQYSATTTASTFDEVTRVLRSWRWVPELRFINHYHDHPAYIAALGDSVRAYWAEQGEPERLLLSFHGIPRDYLLAGDPYHCACQKTARLLAERLALPRERWQIAFQSRVGTKEWLKPYTDEQLESWGRQGVKRVQVLCPGFPADCLETLQEVAMENGQRFRAAGGLDYGYIPALNDDPAHIDLLADLVCQHGAGWPEVSGVPGRIGSPEALAERCARAKALGAPA